MERDPHDVRGNPIRRVVTGHDAEGRSTVIEDGPAKAIVSLGHPDFRITDVWRSARLPVDNSAPFAEPCRAPIELAPSEGGNVLRFAEFPPDREYLGKVNIDAIFADLGDSGPAANTNNTDQAGPHALMHRTDSVDYAFVISGEIYAVLDCGEVLLKAGDVLIQRGTNHAWSNRSNEICRMLFVLNSAFPLGNVDRRQAT